MSQQHDTTADRQPLRSVAHHLSPLGISMPAAPLVQMHSSATTAGDQRPVPVQRFALPENAGAVSQAASPRTDIPPVQGVFYWADHPAEDVADNDKKNGDGIKVFTANEKFRQDFLGYVRDKVLEKEDIRKPDIQKALSNRMADSKAYSLGNKGPNLTDALVSWFIANRKTLSKEFNFVAAAASITGKKRQHYIPPPLAGESTEVAGRLKRTLKREYSIAEGMLHEPLLAYSGWNVSMYTQVNDNATYSIGAYAVQGERAHLLGGSKSGESFGKEYALEKDTKKQKLDTGEKGKEVEEEEEVGTAVKGEKIQMHAEEQQVAAFEDQVAKNSHGLGVALNAGQPVILHLHISKSPCSKQCQGMFDRLLSNPKYKSLEIQLYLENPYMANVPEEMIAEAGALKKLMEKYPGRLAYKVVSAWNAKTAMTGDDHPMRKLGGLEAIIFELIADKDEDAGLAQTRKQRFNELIKGGHLPAEGFVNALH